MSVVVNLDDNVDQEPFELTAVVTEDNENTQESYINSDNIKTELAGIITSMLTSLSPTVNRINVQRKSVLDDYILKRKQCSWFSLQNKIKVVFMGESTTDDGGPKREFFSDVLQLLRMRLFDGNGIPFESTVALTQDLFKYAGELMAMSIIQGGPAPNFISPAIFDVIAKGLCKANLSIDMIENTLLNEVASKINNASTDIELQSLLMEDDVLDVLGEVGYRGVPSQETIASKDNLVRSIIIKSHIELKLGMIKQLEEGLMLCGLLDEVRARPALFRPVFVEDDTFTVTPDDFLDGLVVIHSDLQQEKMAETTTFKHFCDFIDHLSHNGK